ncbi:hypothetical protein L7F22_029487 [Adiantum nelumboides]|nr:hypothetical protein [Adiantum nelumboides]
MRSLLLHGKKACVHRSAFWARNHEQWRWQPLLYALALPHHSPSSFVSHSSDHIVYNKFSTQRDIEEGPSPVDYSSLLDERDFHKLADELLHHLQERFDELGEECDLDGFDVDYAEGVLTIKLGPSGTYVINKQTPNRQIWLSSPVRTPQIQGLHMLIDGFPDLVEQEYVDDTMIFCHYDSDTLDRLQSTLCFLLCQWFLDQLAQVISGPARFDWDAKDHRWVYRRTKAEIFGLLEKEVQELVGSLKLVTSSVLVLVTDFCKLRQLRIDSGSGKICCLTVHSFGFRFAEQFSGKDFSK